MRKLILLPMLLTAVALLYAKRYTTCSAGTATTAGGLAYPDSRFIWHFPLPGIQQNQD